MKLKATFVAMTALVLVAGCNRGATNNAGAANNSVAANTTANAAAPTPATPAPAATAGAPVDRAFLTASAWGSAGCANVGTFASDGTMQSPDGPGTWTLEGNTLTLTQGGRSVPATVSRDGANLVVTNPANPAQSETMVPCPATGGAAADAPEADGE